MIIPDDKIGKMTFGGRILAQIMEEALNFAGPSVTTMQIEYFVRNLMAKYKVEPSFTKVRNYKYHICACVNDTVVHGIPTDYPLQGGDILGLDIGVFSEGFHTDMSWTKLIAGKSVDPAEKKQKEHFLKVGQNALLKAIDEAKSSNRIGHISRAIQSTIEKAKFSVVRQLVGHAVGENLHEQPQIPGVLTKKIEETEQLKEDMTLAIEIIYTMGQGNIIYKNDDGWTIVTKDHSLAGLFEVTVVVKRERPLILTPFARLLNQDN